MPIHRLRRLTYMATAILAYFTAAAFAQSSQHSQLWGERGEKWDPHGRLTDFSYAGYHRGEKPLPTLRPQLSVVNYGAKGDDDIDDTAAVQKAIEAGAGKVIGIPAGRYIITDMLTIRASGTALKGAGADKTVLHFPTPLNDIKPNIGATTSGRLTSNYAWSGGFIRVEGRIDDETEFAELTAPAKRGDTVLTVSDTRRLKRGDVVQIIQRDDDEETLVNYLYAGDPGPTGKLRRVSTAFACRIARVDAAAKRITLDRPLRTDVGPQWSARITAGTSSTEEVGIEGLTFDFPVTPYMGHFTEVGYNAIAFSGVRNCWVRDVVIRNADSGMFIDAVNVTLTGIVVESERTPDERLKATGHHGITLSEQDCLLTDFEFRARFVHDTTMTRGSVGNVIMNGRGVDLAFDHHKYAPHANLYTNVDLGEGSRMFRSGGGADLGRHSAAWVTFWNIRAAAPQAWPKGWAPDLINLVGVQTDQPAEMEETGKWFEPIPPGELQPQNLYVAQLKRRLTKRG